MVIAKWRRFLIEVAIEGMTGALESMPYHEISTEDLVQLAQALRPEENLVGMYREHRSLLEDMRRDREEGRY